MRQPRCGLLSGTVGDTTHGIASGLVSFFLRCLSRFLALLLRLTGAETAVSLCGGGGGGVSLLLTDQCQPVRCCPPPLARLHPPPMGALPKGTRAAPPASGGAGRGRGADGHVRGAVQAGQPAALTSAAMAWWGSSPPPPTAATALELTAAGGGGRKPVAGAGKRVVSPPPPRRPGARVTPPARLPVRWPCTATSCSRSAGQLTTPPRVRAQGRDSDGTASSRKERTRHRLTSCSKSDRK